MNNLLMVPKICLSNILGSFLKSLIALFFFSTSLSDAFQALSNNLFWEYLWYTAFIKC